MLIHPCRRNSAGRRTAGVTLIETIMVVTLLAMATAAGSFMLDGNWQGRRNATDATQQVHATLSAARNTAIVNQTNVQVRRFIQSGVQWLAVTEEPGPLRDGKKWEMEIGDTTTIDGSASDIWFKATGTANRGIEWKIRDGDSAGLVVVTPVDGNITQKLP
ncbi:pilus assembly FimT family protein [Rubripirellula lacrimiformis]|nr:GspH/FimT family pseudopilin [Rubripirellula lacrimiformis]